jgi:hypothetical protein
LKSHILHFKSAFNLIIYVYISEITTTYVPPWID